MSATPNDPPKTRVLVVDDNRDAADTLVLLLRLCGYEAKAEYDGVSGLETAKRFRPDCILSDIGMPGLDGYAFAKKLREDESFNRTPLVAISAAGDETRAAEAGFDRFLVKPVSKAVILELFSKLTKMDSRIEKVEETVRKHGESIGDVADIMKEVRDDVKDIKGGLETKVGELKEELREVKEDVKAIKEELEGSADGKEAGAG